MKLTPDKLGFNLSSRQYSNCFPQEVKQSLIAPVGLGNILSTCSSLYIIYIYIYCLLQDGLNMLYCSPERLQIQSLPFFFPNDVPVKLFTPACCALGLFTHTHKRFPETRVYVAQPLLACNQRSCICSRLYVA